MRTLMVTLSLLLCIAQVAAAQSPDSKDTGNLVYGKWGVDLTARDLTVRAGQDFDRYAGGRWADRTPIPADGREAGAYDDLERLSQRRIASIIETSAPKTRIGALYRSFMNTTGIEAAGLTPLRPMLSAIAAAADRDALAAWLGQSCGGFGIRPIDIDTGTALDDPKTMRYGVSQAQMGLPDRDYYLLDRFQPQRVAYRAYIEKLLTLAGSASPGPEADAVLAFETDIAKAQYSRTEARDPKALRTATVADLEKDAPGFPWQSYLQGAGLSVTPDTQIIIGQDGAVRQIAALYTATPLATLKAWTVFHVIDDAAPYLAAPFVDANFAFRKTLDGVSEQPDREHRALSLVDKQLGDDVGRIYVHRFFTTADKAGAEIIVDNVKAALRRRLANNSWLSPDSRATALAKLDNYSVMLGWPDTWRDYSDLHFKTDDLFGNVAQIRAEDWAFQRTLLTHSLERGRWILSPQTVNAYNGGQELKIVLPAARLQPPYYSRTSDPAVNYGALGALAGHELSHSFDNRGRLVDPQGRLQNWWSDADVKAFESRTAVLGAQYDSYEAVPGVHLNGRLTMSENIADLVGLLAALDAYHASLHGKPAPIRDGLTGDQRFFLAYAQSRRQKQREQDLRDQATRDPHAAGKYRVLGPLRNIDAWYAAFDVKPTDPYYIPPETRARIW